jgi:hypothetical protein
MNNEKSASFDDNNSNEVRGGVRSFDLLVKYVTRCPTGTKSDYGFIVFPFPVASQDLEIGRSLRLLRLYSKEHSHCFGQVRQDQINRERTS